MNRIWYLVLAISVGLNVGLAWTALSPRADAPGPDAPPPGESYETRLEKHLDRMVESLGLDDGQRAAIAGVHERLLPEIVARQKAVHALRREVGDAFRQPTLDAAEFRALVEKLSHERDRLDALVAEAMLGEAAVLTTEQRKKYAVEMPWGRPPGAPGPRSDPPPPGGGRDQPPPGGGR